MPQAVARECLEPRIMAGRSLYGALVLGGRRRRWEWQPVTPPAHEPMETAGRVLAPAHEPMEPKP